MTERDILEMSEVFKVFGDPTRIKILNALKEGCNNNGKCVQCIAEELGMTHSAVSHQLKILRHAYLVKAQKIGKEVYYSLDDDHVTSMFDVCLAHIRHKEED